MAITHRNAYGLVLTLPKSHILTRKMLIAIDACPEQVELFKKIFGSRVYVSQTSLSKAAFHGLNIVWFGMHYTDNVHILAREDCRLAEEYADSSESKKAHYEKLAALVYEHLKFSD